MTTAVLHEAQHVLSTNTVKQTGFDHPYLVLFEHGQENHFSIS